MIVEPEMLPDVATTLQYPLDTAVAKPSNPDSLLTVATDLSDEVHTTDIVKSCTELLE